MAYNSPATAKHYGWNGKLRKAEDPPMMNGADPYSVMFGGLDPAALKEENRLNSLLDLGGSPTEQPYLSPAGDPTKPAPLSYASTMAPEDTMYQGGLLSKKQNDANTFIEGVTASHLADKKKNAQRKMAIGAGMRAGANFMNAAKAPDSRLPYMMPSRVIRGRPQGAYARRKMIMTKPLPGLLI